MWYSCFVERASVRRKSLQGGLPKPAETTTTLSPPVSVPQLAGQKLIWICLCVLVCSQWRRSLTLTVSDLLLLTLLGILLFLSLLSCGFHKVFYVKLKELPSANVTTNVLDCLPLSASCETPRTRVVWRQIKSERQKHPELWRCL